MADKILEANISVIIDLSLTEVELGKEYVNKLLRRFFFLETTMRKPYLIIVEEAEELAPEKGIATTTCLEILRNITKKGGKRGIGIVVIAHSLGCS
jgi:DNA helicase HerA-like ATPase